MSNVSVLHFYFLLVFSHVSLFPSRSDTPSLPMFLRLDSGMSTYFASPCRWSQSRLSSDLFFIFPFEPFYLSIVSSSFFSISDEHCALR